VKTTHTSSVLPSRWSSAALLRRNPKLLSLDIFGFALRPAVLDHEDIHRLVASYLRRKTTFVIDDYLERRHRAEALASRRAANAGRTDLALSEITDQLAYVLGEVVGDGRAAARQAITTELELEQLVHLPNDEALELYRDAKAASIPVAFVGDSYLPRDLIAKMLQKAGYHDGRVLVSSHEGATKSSGRLYESLVERSGLAAERITNVGPDPVTDIARATAAGLTAVQVTAKRADVVHLFDLGLTERTGIDSLGLALAADRLGQVDPDVTPGDLGFYGAGPLGAGFAAWVGRLIDEQRPDHTVFGGPAGRLFRRLVTILRPDLPTTALHELESAAGSSPGPAAIDDFVERARVADGDRLLVVDVGWNGQTHEQIAGELQRRGHSVRIDGAYLGTLDAPGADEPVQVWAFDGRPDRPVAGSVAALVEVLAALVPPSEPWRARPNHVGDYRAIAPLIAEGIVAFAEQFQPWLRLDKHDVSAALAEPALRIVSSPTHAEAQLLGRYRSAGELGTAAVPLAVLPIDGEIARNPRIVEVAEATSIWQQGYQALARGDEQRSGSARRLRRGLRKALPRDQPS